MALMTRQKNRYDHATLPVWVNLNAGNGWQVVEYAVFETRVSDGKRVFCNINPYLIYKEDTIDCYIDEISADYPWYRSDLEDGRRRIAIGLEPGELGETALWGFDVWRKKYGAYGLHIDEIAEINAARAKGYGI